MHSTNEILDTMLFLSQKLQKRLLLPGTLGIFSLFLRWDYPDQVLGATALQFGFSSLSSDGPSSPYDNSYSIAFEDISFKFSLLG